jgi:hypothetical protein
VDQHIGTEVVVTFAVVFEVDITSNEASEVVATSVVVSEISVVVASEVVVTAAAA